MLGVFVYCPEEPGSPGAAQLVLGARISACSLGATPRHEDTHTHEAWCLVLVPECAHVALQLPRSRTPASSRHRSDVLACAYLRGTSARIRTGRNDREPYGCHKLRGRGARPLQPIADWDRRDEAFPGR